MASDIDLKDIDQLAKQKRAELRRLQKELERLEELRKNRLKLSSPEIRHLAREVSQLAKDHLMDSEDVLNLIAEALSKSSKRGGTRGPVPPKYRNPNNPQDTWTGRGRQPRWVSELLEQGYTLEQLKIDS